MEPDPSEEEFAVDGSINDQRRRQARGTKSREEGGRLPVAVRYARKQSLALGRPSPRTGHVRFGPRFVDEHEPIRIQERLLPIKQHRFCKSRFSEVGHLASMFR